MTKQLTKKQMMFVGEYLTHFNATKAAIAAGYSAKTAYSIGSENLKKPEIRGAIEAQMSSLAERQLISQTSIIFELSRYAFRSRESSHGEVSSRDAIAALVLLGKHVGMFWEKAATTGKADYELAFEEAYAAVEQRRLLHAKC